MNEKEFIKKHPSLKGKLLYYDRVANLQDIHDTQIDKKKIKKVISNHTIRNSDGEYYIACPPEILLKALEAD